MKVAPSSRRASAALCWLLVVVAADSARATELYRAGDFSLSLSGSFREIFQVTHQTDASDFEEAILQSVSDDLPGGPFRCLEAAVFAECPAFGEVGERRVIQSATRARTRLDLSLTSWLRAELVYDMTWFAGRIDTLEAGLSNALFLDTFLGAEGTILSRKHLDWTHGLYRGLLHAEGKHIDFRIGRQHVGWGVGRLWTPMDRFNANPPLDIDPDDPEGVDSVLLRWNFDGFNFAEAVYAPGDRARESRYALRLHGVVADTDLTAMVGSFHEAPSAGVDMARNLGDAALRFEAVFTHPQHKVWRLDADAPERPDDYWQVLVSIDNNFAYGTGVYLLFEYLYNGNALGVGEGRAGPLLGFFEATDELPVPPPPTATAPFATPATVDVLAASRVVTAVAHQLGVVLGYDITPEIRGDFITLLDCTEGSAAFFPTLGYTPTGSLELTLGAQFFAGPRHSQYGSAEPVGYLLAEWFF